MGDTGLEHSCDFPRSADFSLSGGAECGALGAQFEPIDPELQAIIDVWPKLPEAIKAGILAMVHTAGGEK